MRPERRWVRGCAMRSKGENTLVSIPARARAVYAPREKPKMHILSPYSSIQTFTARLRNKAAITYNFASEIRIQLKDGVGPF